MARSYDEPMDDDEDDLEPAMYLHSMQGMPPDARLMGLDRNVPEGAWLSFAGSLNATKSSHRLVAWLLLVVFIFPLLLEVKSALP